MVRGEQEEGELLVMVGLSERGSCGRWSAFEISFLFESFPFVLLCSLCAAVLADICFNETREEG